MSRSPSSQRDRLGDSGDDPALGADCGPVCRCSERAAYKRDHGANLVGLDEAADQRKRSHCLEEQFLCLRVRMTARQNTFDEIDNPL